MRVRECPIAALRTIDRLVRVNFHGDRSFSTEHLVIVPTIDLRFDYRDRIAL